MTCPRTALALLALVVALLAAGCGGEEPPDRPAGAGGPATTAEPSGAPEDGAPTGGDCGDVGFTPQSDNGAFAIQARGVDCATAREVAAGAEDRRGGAYQARGFSCASTGSTGGPLPAIRYRCEGGGGVITFEAS